MAGADDDEAMMEAAAARESRPLPQPQKLPWFGAVCAYSLVPAKVGAVCSALAAALRGLHASSTMVEREWP